MRSFYPDTFLKKSLNPAFTKRLRDISNFYYKPPLNWLETISSYRATISGGPNFAYGLCARKVTPEQLEKFGLLGFLHDYELFVTSRLNDLINIRGNNHYQNQ